MTDKIEGSDNEVIFIECDVCLRHYRQEDIIENVEDYSVLYICQKCANLMDDKYGDGKEIQND